LALRRGRALGPLLALVGACALAAFAPAARAAEFGIVPGSFSADLLDADGNPEARAGSHPDRMQIDFALTVAETGTTARELVIEMPAGIGGNPDAVPECSRQLYEEGGECPAETQVGRSRFGTSGGVEIELPIFQLEPKPGQLLAFGSRLAADVQFSMELRPGDFGITLSAPNPQQVPVDEGHIELWGVPADHQEGTTIARRPFLTAPARCGPLVFVFRTRSWQEGAPWLSAETESGAPLSGCENLAFDPSLALRLDNPVADSPTGARLDLEVPDDEDADGLASAQIEELAVSLPDGVTVSPAAAVGLATCSDAQLGLGDNGEARCPPASRVGAVELVSPAMPDPLSGAIYLGEERPGERFRLFVVAPGPGIVLKFAGALRPDPVSGRISTTLAGLPQVAIRRLSMIFAGGAHALLASPLQCGPAVAVAKIDPHGGGARAERTASVLVQPRAAGHACSGLPPFDPQLATTSSSSRAGRSTAFSATLRRADGEQLPRRFSLALPAGLSAALGRVRPCAEPLPGACSGESRIGTVRARIGSGADGVGLNGVAYLTGPYRKAPFGLLIVLPAALGPFDFGSVSLRATADLDRRSGRVVVSTDTLPVAIDGMQLRFQAIELAMDRPGLVRNPTSCSARQVDAWVEAQGGALASPTSSFRVRGCRRLGFAPRVSMALRRRDGPDGATKVVLQTSVRPRRGDTNLKAMTIALPAALGLDIGGIGEICSLRDAGNGTCPPGARVGVATARTELLGERLRGAVYVAQPHGEGQPDLVVVLEAAGARVVLQGHTRMRDGRLVARLQGLPDIPLATLQLQLGGAGEGAVELSGGLCEGDRGRRLATAITLRGQNGVQRSRRLPLRIKAPCR
jgi:hypothetical protein